MNGEAVDTKDFKFAIRQGRTELALKFEAIPHLKERPGELYALQMGSLLFSVPIAYEKKMREYTRKVVERKFPYCDYQFIPKTSWNYGFSEELLLNLPFA